MPFLALLLLGTVGWALWSGKVRFEQLPPMALALGGAMLALRGGWMIGIPAVVAGVAWYRGMNWRLFGLKSQQSGEFTRSKARWLLGVAAHDDADRIRARHRQLIAENHPDRGGSEERAKQLNEARDLLLDDLARKSG